MDDKDKLEQNFLLDEILESYFIIPRDLMQLDNTNKACEVVPIDEQKSLKIYEESLKSNEHQIPSSNFREFSLFESSIQISQVSPVSETQDSRQQSPLLIFPTGKS
jgi:hypothetical protein